MACVGCLAAVVLGMLATLLIVATMTRQGGIPEPFRSLSDINRCQQNLTELTSALQRYEIRNKAYPERLTDLYPDYLKSDAVLWCPIDHAHLGGTSYIYRQPAADAPPATVVIRCLRHEPSKEVRVILGARLDGKIEVKTEPTKPGKPPLKKGMSGK